VDVGDDGITAPQQNGAAMQKILRGVATHRAVAFQLSGYAGAGAQAAPSLSHSTPEVEKTLVQCLEQAHGTSTLIVQDRQRAIFGPKACQAFGQSVEGFVPGDAAPATFGAFQRMTNAAGTINTRWVLVGLLA